MPRRGRRRGFLSLEYNKKLIQNAKELRKNQTPQERKLWYDFLSKYPVRFQRQKVIENFITDFYCAKARLVVELDESGHYSAEKVKYDNDRTLVLEQHGLMVLRFSNLEITSKEYAQLSIIL